MLFLRSWLEDYIDLNQFSNQDLAKKFTSFSMEVEEIREIKDYYQGLVVVGRILEPKPVEGSDKLRVFDVDLGFKTIQIVSAAANVEAGQYVVVALTGAKLPHGMTISERKMMGHVTQGMCLGKSELCLEDGYSSDLWEIETELQNLKFDFSTILGKSICEVLPHYFPMQTVFDIKVLPNSMGILSNHLGLAYEIALILGNFNLLKPSASLFLDFEQVVKVCDDLTDLRLDQTQISFEDKTNYSRYFSLHQLSLDANFNLPALIAQRLFLIEQNSVSAVVDISNYLIYDIGQPIHFFSKAKLEAFAADSKTHLSIREAGQSTEFSGLGQLKKTVLDPQIMAIYAGDQAIILPGISGGQSTMVEAGETEIYLELANFDPEMVAKNSFNLGFDRSQATRVFAGNVPSLKLLIALIRLNQIFGPKTSITSLILSAKDNFKLSFKEFCDFLKADFEAEMELDLDYFKTRIGGDFSEAELCKSLKNLGKLEALESENSDTKFTFNPNKLYTAYEIQEDILGDLARLGNLLNIDAQSLEIMVNPETDLVYRPILLLKKFIASLGFTETINRPFISEKIVQNLPDGKAQSLLILNPIRSQEPYNRIGLLESLLQTTRKNLDSGKSQINIFELNKVYSKPILNQSNQNGHKIVKNIQERILLSALTTDLNMQDLASVMQQILAKMNQKIDTFLEVRNDLILNGFEAENSQIKLKIYQINNSTKKKFEIPFAKNLGYLEIDITDWDRNLNLFEKYYEDREFPDLKRSLSLLIPANLTFSKVKNTILSLPLILEKEFEVAVNGVERIAGSEINEVNEKTKSPDILNLDIRLNHHSGTISGEEGNLIEDSIITALQQNFDATIVRR